VLVSHNRTLPIATTTSSSHNRTSVDLNSAQAPHHHQRPHENMHEHDQAVDQFIPPSVGNLPSIVPLNKITPETIEHLLHHLTGSEEAQEGVIAPPGAYIHVQTPQQVQQLEREVGAKFVGEAEDGSFVLLIPPTAQLRPIGAGLPHGRPRPNNGHRQQHPSLQPNAVLQQPVPGSHHSPPYPPRFPPSGTVVVID